MLYTDALACAPLVVLQNSQFFRPTTNGRIAFSASLLEIGMLPSRRKVQSACFWPVAYPIGLEQGALFRRRSLVHHLQNSSRIGTLRF